MFAARVPVSLLKPEARLDTLEILDGVPNGFMALLGFIFDGNIETHGEGYLIHRAFELPDLWPDKLTHAVKDLYDKVRSDPHAFTAVMTMPDVSANVAGQLRELADAGHARTEMDTSQVLKAFENQVELVREARRTPAAEPAQEQQADLRDRPRRTAEESQPPEMSDRPESEKSGFELEDMLDMAEAVEQEHPWQDSGYHGDFKPDLTDLLLIDPVAPPREEEKPEAGDGEPCHARAWDNLSHVFETSAATASQTVKATDYARDIAKTAFNIAKDGPFSERPDNTLPLADRPEIGKTPQAEVDTALAQPLAVNSLPI